MRHNVLARTLTVRLPGRLRRIGHTAGQLLQFIETRGEVLALLGAQLRQRSREGALEL